MTLTGTLGGSTITITSPAKLQTLICDNLGLTAIDLSAAPNLRSLYCQNNALTTLDLGGCKLLTDLNCANNKLSSISLDATPVLETVNLSDNELTGTFAYKSSTLQHLNISGNAYTGVNLNSNTNLDVLKCAETSVKSVATISNAISVIMCGNSAVSSMTINGTMPSLRDVFAENKLFATLDTTVRKVIIDNLPFLLADTVGFIRKLPTDLVESFKSTLDEVREADLLVHVVDVSHPDFMEQIEVVNNTLRDLGCAEKPQLLVFNKMDAYTWTEKDPDDLTPATRENVSLDELKHTWMAKMGDDCIFISARERQNIDELKELFYARVKQLHVQKYPYNDFLFEHYEQQ